MDAAEAAPPADAVPAPVSVGEPEGTSAAPDPKRKKHKSKAQQLKQAIRQLREDYLPRLQKYEDQQETLDGRNSYSKTDSDSTFMCRQDDHMGNGQLKAGYNVQIGTEDQFVLGFTLHQNPGDPGCLIPNLKQTKQQLGRLPDNIVADSAYSSEENYAYLDQEQVGNYLKYNTFYQEHRPHFKPKPFDANFWPYDPEQDTFTCPQEQPLHFVSIAKSTPKTALRPSAAYTNAPIAANARSKPSVSKQRAIARSGSVFACVPFGRKPTKTCVPRKASCCVLGVPPMWRRFSDASSKIGAFAGSSYGD